MNGQSHPIPTASAGHHADAAPRVTRDVTGTPRYLTVADLAARWRVAPYTIGKWARAKRITDAHFALGEWTFLETSRLRVGAKGAPRADREQLLDLTAYPKTVADLAEAWGLAEDTIRRWARAGMLATAFYTPMGWRFDAEVADPRKPLPIAASGRLEDAGNAPPAEGEDMYASLRALSFTVRHLAPPTSGRTATGKSPAGRAAFRKIVRGPRAMYRR
ncbi:hypothetical protein [Gemmatimonas sp.]|uniref:hypothetical protein n=1 Tax=Gemmatimonas sp. TaxID=1962908 RepID=UPI0025BB2EA6|nr:hypothetical protein [Gemmatimonas sp.]MCA2993957.1 hypothetical protein [Gemmatimonas sp.]